MSRALRCTPHSLRSGTSPPKPLFASLRGRRAERGTSQDKLRVGNGGPSGYKSDSMEKFSISFPLVGIINGIFFTFPCPNYSMESWGDEMPCCC